jgi:hypothetical protein
MTISILTNRRAMTLVEMLVGMAITLVMMAAVVNLFANISEGVRNRRATMEVAANLRIARTRLFNDLAGATCLKYPKDAFGWMPQPDVNNPPDGYFEIVEGRFADENSGGEFDPATSLVPSSNLPYNDKGEPLDPNIVTDGGGLGDYDDVLAMTVESESERFRGRGRGLEPGGNPTNIGNPPNYTDGDWVDMTISSPVAEVVWFAVQTPRRDDPRYRPEMGEPGLRRIYRRTLLVAPWYGTATVQNSGPPVTGSDPLLDVSGLTTYQAQVEQLRRFQETYDISARLENGRIVPNTLADLSRRENRFAHAPNDSITPASTFPHQFPYNIGNVANYYRPDAETVDADNFGSLRRLTGERQNEDLVLDNVLAFDVQVFDPGAPLFNISGTIIPPSSSNAFVANASNTGSITGFGAYVDLGWNNNGDYNYSTLPAALSNSPAPLFQQERRVGWHPALPTDYRGNPSVYDTWTTYYESDRVNQDMDFSDATGTNENIDEGTNGLDDPNPTLSGNPLHVNPPGDYAANGPDDPLERETSPPYPYALRGVQVKLRIYEPESRQIRETTVTRNLIK